jgi:hypothetical protein
MAKRIPSSLINMTFGQPALRRPKLVNDEQVNFQALPGTTENKNILCLDPGTTHLAAAIINICPDTHYNAAQRTLTVCWEHMYRVDHDPEKMANAVRSIIGMCDHFLVEDALVEFQAPIGRSAQCRWNAYVEGGLAVCLAFQKFRVHTLQPSVVKRKLGLATGNYKQNKDAAVDFAKSLHINASSDHIADCVCLAEYWRRMDVFDVAEELE